MLFIEQWTLEVDVILSRVLLYELENVDIFSVSISANKIISLNRKQYMVQMEHFEDPS